MRNPCFNCGQTDHPRAKCRRPRTVCRHCNANHVDELCPRGPGGKLRDSISTAARSLLDKQAGVTTQAGTSSNSVYNARTEPDQSRDWLFDQYQAYVARKRNRSPERDMSSSTRDNRTSSHSSSRQQPSTTPCLQQPAMATSSQQVQHPPAITAHSAAGAGSITYRDLDDYFDSLPSSFRAYVATGTDEAYALAVNAHQVHGLAFVDSQASNFVVPSVEYLSEITDDCPNNVVDTANGPAKPAAVGTLELKLFDDSGGWHTFRIHDVCVLSGCNRVLYSQAVMSRLGVIHRLDEGYVLLPGGARKSILKSSYSIEVSFPALNARQPLHRAESPPTDPRLRVHTASSLAVPMHQSITRRDRGADTKASVPQQLVWQRLGFPSRTIWSNIQAVLTDHGLPDATHLRHNFPMLEAVARARARALPFHEMRDADHLPAPGAMIYMDFAGPLTPSYPHGFTFYAGAIDAGSGYARVVPCHSATKEVAQQCLELLLADLRMLMGLSHKLRPQIVVSDHKAHNLCPTISGISLPASRLNTGLHLYTLCSRTRLSSVCGARALAWRAPSSSTLTLAQQCTLMRYSVQIG